MLVDLGQKGCSGLWRAGFEEMPCGPCSSKASNCLCAVPTQSASSLSLEVLGRRVKPVVIFGVCLNLVGAERRKRKEKGKKWEEREMVKGRQAE